MKRRVAVRWIPALSLTLTLVATAGRAQVLLGARAHVSPATSAPARSTSDSFPSAPSANRERVLSVIERHLGRPYVWGACGIKSFDCSGFVWRVMQENGVLVKRTTARKFYMSLPRVSDEERWTFGNIVFFSDLKHCGIVETREGFYHAAVSTGTHLAQFDPFWRRKISGVRAMPGHGH